MDQAIKERLKNAVNGLIDIIDENPCGMGTAMYNILTIFIKELIKHFSKRRYLSTDEAASMLGISPRTLRRRVKEGEIPAPKHYGHWEVSYKREDIEDYLCNNDKLVSN